MNEGEFENSYFESEHDRCSCKASDVRPVLPDVLAQVGGANYEIPKGWCGFGLKLKPADVKIFSCQDFRKLECGHSTDARLPSFLRSCARAAC